MEDELQQQQQLEDYLFKESEVEKTIDIDIPAADYPSVVDRFFTRYYQILPDKLEDHLVLYHSNRVCLVGLAATHIAFKKGVESVRYDIGNCDRAKNAVKGKGKKGGMPLQPNSTIAIVKCKDGTEYRVQSCITGKLIEVNMRLLDNIDLLAEEGMGYVAIVLPKPEHCADIKQSLFTQLQYNMLRSPSTTATTTETSSSSSVENKMEDF